MRAPSFKGLRDDKPPEDCVLERPGERVMRRRARAPRSSLLAFVAGRVHSS